MDAFDQPGPFNGRAPGDVLVDVRAEKKNIPVTRPRKNPVTGARYHRLGTLASASVLLAASFAAGQELDRGRVIEKVACAADPARSYALYLPSSFDAARSWPVLVLFDAGARGPLAVEAFREAAEVYGWMLAASNDSRNGPMEDSVRAARATWADVSGRLPVDGRRIYAAGFSGGSRVASLFPRMIGRTIAGIVGCGAGLSTGLAPTEVGAAAYLGLAGFSDFNYPEMKALDLSLDPAGVAHRVFFFEGVHEWPDAAVCARALGWMEVAAMKAGARPKDETIARAVVGREIEDADAFEAAGRPFWAVERLEAARWLAAGVIEIPDPAGRIDGLRAAKAYGRFVADEKKRDRRAEEFRAGFARAFGAIEDPESFGPASAPGVLREMKVGFLRKEARSAKAIEDRGAASRMIFELSFAAQARATELFGKGDRPRAAAYLDLAIEACEDGLFRKRYLYLSRARVAAAAGDQKGALKFLASAVDAGFRDAELLETAEDFRAIRDGDEFRRILEKIRALRE